jgi:hypothetical protein
VEQSRRAPFVYRRTMRTGALRVTHALLLAGFILVLVGAAGWFYAVETDDPLWQQFLWNVAPPVAYGLVGWAWWQWADFAAANPIAVNLLRRTSRTIAVASFALSIVYFDSLYRIVHFHLDHPGTYAHVLSGVATNAVEALGFCLAALGFWLASSTPSHTRASVADVAPRDVASVGAGHRLGGTAWSGGRRDCVRPGRSVPPGSVASRSWAVATCR